MLRRMSADELTEWQAYEKVTGPLGAERLDVLATLVAYYVVTALGAKNARLDRMLPQWERKPDQSWQSMKLIVEALNRQFDGTVT
jgi:hypothetical protein